MVVALVGAPPAMGRQLAPLPDLVRLRRSARGHADLTLWFVRSVRDLERRLDQMISRSRHSGLWIVWPKQTSPLHRDLNETIIRTRALAAGMVDFKVCAVDQDWSGLRFNMRDQRRSR